MLTGLDHAQLAATTAPLGPLRVLAGPGAGKTRTVVARIQHLVDSGQVEARHILALSHTTKAAGELRDRITANTNAGSNINQVTSSTIHAAAWYQIRHLWAQTGWGEQPQLLTSVYNHVRNAFESAVGRRIEQAELLDMVAEIDWARARLLTPATYPDAAPGHGRVAPTGDYEHVAATWEAFRAAKTRANLVDFGDVLAAATIMIRDHAHIAEAVRRKWQAFFVDEYQDIDHAQQALLDAWLGERDTLTVVADPNQAIYGFKGADPALLDELPRRYPHCRTVELTANYRSTPQIVTWVNALRTIKNQPLEGRQAPGATPEVRHTATEATETASLVRQIRDWQHAGIPASEIAVLYRFNATAARVEAALSTAGISYHALGGGKFFDRTEIRQTLELLNRLATSQPDTPASEAILACATRNGYDPDQAPEGAGATRNRWESLHALVTIVAEQLGELNAAELARELARRARDAHEPTPGGVRIGTIHAAKGLEWDAVWVIGVVEGQLPSAYAKSPEQLREEQNACYVAVSRARHHLVLSVAARRANNWTQKPSRFLDLLPLARPAARTAAPSRRTGSSSNGRRPDAGPPVSAEFARQLDTIGRCERCQGRLIGAAARKARRCSPECLEVATKAFYDTLVTWRASRAEATGRALNDIATERGLFTYAVTRQADTSPGLYDRTDLPR